MESGKYTGLILKYENKYVMVSATEVSHNFIEKYDVIMTDIKTGEVIKSATGCLGSTSMNYWSNYLIKIAMRYEMLMDMKQSNPDNTMFIQAWISEILE